MNRTRKIVRQWIAGALAVTMLSAAMAAPAFAAPEGTESTASETTATVVDWSWTDAASLTWQEDTQSWLLSLTEDQTLSGADDLKALLPDAVDAKVTETAVDTAETADASLDLTWDTSALTFPLEGGDYTVTASLPEGYALAEDVPAPAVTVQVPGGNGDTTGDTQLPPATNFIQRAPQANRPSLLAENTPDTVDTVDPVGTTINLFDYSVKDNDLYAPDDSFYTREIFGYYYDYGDLITGINKNHILKFSKDSDDLPVQGGNKYDEKKDRYPGIVADVLGEDHFPKLSDDAQKSWAGTGNNEKLTANESLAYLFDPSQQYEQSYRKSYTNVKGLLKVENGYYTYNSSENYAYFDQDQNRFTVYNGAPDNAAYFFPFNTYGEVTSNDDSSANHYFGMTMTTRFVQQNGGRTTDGTDTPITYEFAGDDDVWVFIDGVLVGDIGGIHGKTSLKIDFSTGEILVNGVSDGTLLQKFQAAKQDDKTSWSGSTFADKTYHTLQFFYLERGNYDSNLFLKFNMESVSESSINNVDQDGYGKSGLTFSLYATGDDYNVSASTPVYTGTTEANGVLNMVDESGNNVKLSNLRDNYPNGYFVLREINPPAGYRSLGDVHLKFMENSNLDILLAANPWDSGAYATPTVTATLPRYVYADGDTTNTRIDTQDQDTLKGTFFAVVLKRNAAGDNNTNDWLPVYGDAMTGWQVEADSSWNSVLEAAQKNPYVFAVDNTGLRTTIENLPGDLAKYYYILQQNGDTDAAGNAEYTVAYYYTTATSLDGATQDNTKRLDTTRAGDEEIQREFSVRVYVPNVKNYLIVQGVAKDGTTALSDATFDLYTADQVTEVNGSYTINAGEQPYDTVTTEDMDQNNGDSITAQGAGIFPSDSSHVLAAGTYYLKERTTPEGYEPSDQIVKVIVDNTGVYADAGEQNDDVTVLRGAGKIVRSMLQFAVPDAINTTLADITATLNTLPEGQDPSTSQAWTSTGQTMNLSYHASDVVLEYGLSDSEGDPYFVVDEGWSRVTIKQNYNNGQLAHDEASVPNAGPKEEVTNDLTNLFSRSTIVRVKSDVQLCTLTISNKVNVPVGNDSNQSFTINVTLTDGQGNPLNDSYSYSGGKLQDQEFAGVQAPAGGTLNLSSGTGTVSLTSGQTVTIEDIPYWSKFTVTETGADNYNKSYQATVSDISPHAEGSASGTMQGNTTVAITNTRKTGSVSLTQNVSGPMGSYTDEFTYTLKLYDQNASTELPISGTYQATFTPKDGTEQSASVTFASDGTAAQITVGTETKAISLQDGDVLTLANLPAGAVCKVTEDANSLGYTTTVGNQSAMSGTVNVPADTATPASITFTNTRAAITPTGLREENNPYIAMVGLAGVAALLAAGGWVRTRRRRREED